MAVLVTIAFDNAVSAEYFIENVKYRQEVKIFYPFNGYVRCTFVEAVDPDEEEIRKSYDE